MFSDSESDGALRAGTLCRQVKSSIQLNPINPIQIIGRLPPYNADLYVHTLSVFGSPCPSMSPLDDARPVAVTASAITAARCAPEQQEVL